MRRINAAILAVLGAALFSTGGAAVVSGSAQVPARPIDAQQTESQFGIVIVDETVEQREFRLPNGMALNDGAVMLPPPHVSTRHSRAELLLMWTPNDGWLTRRRMITVDGQSAPTATESSFESLVARGVSAVTDAVAVMRSPSPVLRASSLIPLVDYPVWSIAMLVGSERRRAGLADATVHSSSGQIEIRTHDADTDIRISVATDAVGRIKRAELTAQPATASVTVTVDYDPSKPFLPKKATERYQSGLEVISTDVAYSHIRRFSSSGVPLDQRRSERR